MAGETVLIPKERYERLLKISESYANMQDSKDIETVAKPSTVQEPTSETADENEGDVFQNSYKRTGASQDKVGDDELDESESRPPQKKIKFGSVKMKMARPPGIPLDIIKTKLNNVNKKSKGMSKVKKSKTWLTW